MLKLLAYILKEIEERRLSGGRVPSGDYGERQECGNLIVTLLNRTCGALINYVQISYMSVTYIQIHLIVFASQDFDAG